MRTVRHISKEVSSHWVGDGFPVRSIFSYHSHGEQHSPFLLLDYAGPMKFEPTERPRGVGQHPHRGFETVTIVSQGEVAHRDSTGQGGIIGPGDVQWMTAGQGILHDEFHSEHFTKTGGTLEMVQLWVNLPTQKKMMPPNYQGIAAHSIPVVPLSENQGSVRVIAGEYADKKGPAITQSPIQLLDVQVEANAELSFEMPASWTFLIVVLKGTLLVNTAHVAREAELVRFANDESEVRIEVNSKARFLILSGEPLNEPIVGYGPFVMNSEAEVVQAIQDFNSGKFGELTKDVQ